LNITHDEFVKYRQKHYVGENIMVSVAGGCDMKKVTELTKRYFSELNDTQKDDMERDGLMGDAKGRSFDVFRGPDL
jgi:predicted Zn-dependent peptidase